MSDKLANRLAEDRALRDAALAIVKADLANLRTDISVKSVGERLVGRASEGAVDLYEEAKDLADNHRGILATLIAAIFVWFARSPIADFFSDSDIEEDDFAD